jgi:hypothetical protein
VASKLSERGECLNWLGNLECLELSNIIVESDPSCQVFVEMPKLRQLTFNGLKIHKKSQRDFFKKFPNLEELNFKCELSNLHLDYLSNFMNLKFLTIEYTRPLHGLDFLKQMSNLVSLKFGVRTRIDQIGQDTFKELKQLEILKISATAGPWMRHLTNLGYL